jgi:hypothetical protein
LGSTARRVNRISPDRERQIVLVLVEDRAHLIEQHERVAAWRPRREAAHSGLDALGAAEQ